MRWESANGYRPRETARTWSIQDSGSFGERPVLDRDYRELADPVGNDILMHYGVPGMKWGVITKEYIKKGYDTAKRRLAIQKMQRQAENRAAYEAMYRKGQNAARGTAFYSNKVNPILRERARQEKKNQPDLIERSVKKLADKYGLGAYAKLASDKIKELGQNKIYDILHDAEKVKALQRGADAVGKGGGWLLSKGVQAAPHVKRGLTKAADYAYEGTRKVVTGTPKLLAKGAVSATRWLKNGGAAKIQRVMVRASSIITKYDNYSTKALYAANTYASKGSKILSLAVRRGSKALRALLRSR